VPRRALVVLEDVLVRIPLPRRFESASRAAEPTRPRRAAIGTGSPLIAVDDL
jgi:hypothetical protein